MGSGSSTHVTDVESYQDQQEDDVDAVATPLRPAYAPTSQTTAAAPWVAPSQRADLPRPPPYPAGAPRPRGPTHTPWAPPQPPAGSSLPFQPTPPRACTHVGYYPVAGTGVGALPRGEGTGSHPTTVPPPPRPPQHTPVPTHAQAPAPGAAQHRPRPQVRAARLPPVPGLRQTPGESHDGIGRGSPGDSGHQVPPVPSVWGVTPPVYHLL
ncbi:uncharacterized protein [Panulirus ornatus]|uniref:uncharacterized protein n=1 Tax=Panulirus ornatus TaxID=150431 RepID=UPI003A86A79F